MATSTPNPKCTRCKCYWKPDENDIKTSGVVCKTCRKCRNKYKKEYYQQNADKKKEYNKEYNRQNADKLKEYQKEYHRLNADKKKEYRQQNAEKIKQQKKNITNMLINLKNIANKNLNVLVGN